MALLTVFLLTLLSYVNAQSGMATIFMNVPNWVQAKVVATARDVSDPHSSNYGKYLTYQQMKHLTFVNESVYVATFLDSYPVLSYNFHGDNFEVFGDEDDVVTILSSIPANVSQYIYFVEGIDETPLKKNITRHNRPSNLNRRVGDITPDSGFVGRETILRLHNISGQLSVTTTTSIALIEFADGGFYFQDYNDSLNLNNVNSTTTPVVIGGDAEAGTESSLDVEMSSITAQNVSIIYINYSGSQWIASFTANISNMVNPPDVCSVSYGWSVYQQCMITTCGFLTNDQYVALSDYYFAKIALRGVTVVVSSGDSGAPSRFDASCSLEPTTQAEYPSASPFVLSVGGMFVVNGTTTF